MRFLQILLLSLLVCFPAFATPLPLAEFGILPIAHEGRIKPISVFARSELEYISGKSKWQKRPAIAWLAQMVFKPETLDDEHLILLDSEPLRQHLALPPRATHLYALTELRKSLITRLPEVLEAVLLVQKEKPVTPLQERLAELYARVQRFQQIQDSLSFLLPFPSNQKTNLFELAKEDRKTFKPKILATLNQMEERGSMSHVLAVVPATWEEHTDWYSPWSLRFNGKASPQTAEYVKAWNDMATAYRAENTEAWQQAVERSHDKVAVLAAGTEYQPLLLQLEEWYYRLSFISLAIGFYILFILSVIPAQAGIQRVAKWIPAFAGMTALALHSLAMIVRMMILGRPPVSNLYESVLFVSLLTAAIGGALAWKEQKTIIAIFAAAMAALLLLVSQNLLGGQEQLPVVMAVLNTDFWLATHVICITAGYAAAIIASLMAHYYLWKNTGARSLKLTALIALLLTAVGTLLGGIWADQSWGRFWGWDPKENGAMLIVLWLIWLIHGRLAGQFSERWYLAGMAFLSAIVSLAWFGVNLLSVGLHSYGFTEGTAIGLFAFIAFEAIIIAGLLFRSRRYV